MGPVVFGFMSHVSQSRTCPSRTVIVSTDPFGAFETRCSLMEASMASLSYGQSRARRRQLAEDYSVQASVNLLSNRGQAWYSSEPIGIMDARWL